MTADLRFQAIYTFNTLILMVTLIIDSCCDFGKTSEWTPRGGLNCLFFWNHLEFITLDQTWRWTWWRWPAKSLVVGRLRPSSPPLRRISFFGQHWTFWMVAYVSWPCQIKSFGAWVIVMSCQSDMIDWLLLWKKLQTLVTRSTRRTFFCWFHSAALFVISKLTAR